jgi:hypothetical protein
VPPSSPRSRIWSLTAWQVCSEPGVNGRRSQPAAYSRRRPEPSPLSQWTHRFIDRGRPGNCTDLLAVDLDGDGQFEIICGEHETYQPYRTGARLLIYKKADAAALSWTRYMLDDRFDHHGGAKTLRLADGRTGIISHGWADRKYVHLWQPR